MAQVVINLKPAPDIPQFPKDLPPEIKQWAENVQRWCRDCEKAIRTLQAAANAGT